MYGSVRSGILLFALAAICVGGAAEAFESYPVHQRDHGRPAAISAEALGDTFGRVDDPAFSAAPTFVDKGDSTSAFCTDAAINIAGSGPANPYPSLIGVAGTSGVITEVGLRLRNVLHTNTARLLLRLQHPSGPVVALNGSGFDPSMPPYPTATFADWRYSDRAQIYGLFGDNLSWTAPTGSNHYLPRDFAAPQLPPPGPASIPRQLLSSLEGLPAEGSWALWAAQAAGSDPQPLGTIADGWCLDLTTAAAAPGCYHTVEITGSLNAGDVQQAGRISRDGSPSLCGHPRVPATLENNIARRRDAHLLVNPSPNPVCVTATADFSGCGGNQTMLVLYSTYNPAQPHLNVIGESGYSTIGRVSFSTRLTGGQSYTAVVHEVDAGTGCPLYRIRLETNTCLPPAAGDRIFYSGFQLVIPI